MKHCSYERLLSDSTEIPEGELFLIYKDQTFAYAIKINNRFVISNYSTKDDTVSIRQAIKQIRFCKVYGWSKTGMKTEKDGKLKTLFVCLYCKQTTHDISEPCTCRNIKKEDLYRKTPSGIILLV